MTEDVLREWKSTSSSGYKLPGPVPMARFIYEFCWAVVRGDLPLQKCKVALESADFSDGKCGEGMASVFADTVAHLVQDPSVSTDIRTRLVKLVKWLVESEIVAPRLLQERCEEEFLWESELTKLKAQDLKAKEVRVNTRLLYQQTKFNLLREESEGYAKLVTLLCQSGSESTAEASSESSATISIIKSLIGHFDLDPNRVFDIVLECFELFPDRDIFYDLIPIFPKSHASQILGFKFQYYQRMEVNAPVPFGLYRLAALLIKAELIDLDSLYAHLLPRDDEAFELYDTHLAKRMDEVNKIGKINLAATGKDLMDEDKVEMTTDLFASLDMEDEAVKERAPELESNQGLCLLLGFLSVDDWHHAHILFDRLLHLNPTEHIQICDGLLKLIDKSISPSYATVCQMHLNSCKSSTVSAADSAEPSGLLMVPTPLIELPDNLFHMLSFAGPYLYRNPLLLQKVCRVLRAYLCSAWEPAAATDTAFSNRKSVRETPRLKDVRFKVESALGNCLLPSLQLIPANPAIGQEIWEVLSLLPYETRYRLYGEWEKEDERLPVVLGARQLARLETRRILKRLAKENLKQKGRMVAKLAHANPVTVLRTIVHQIEAYRDMITPVVDAFKYLTQLEYDILEYVVIERLAQGGREKLKDDGLNLSDWLQSLASFWGHLCKKYPSMELRGLFQYLVNQLKKGIGVELVVLQELIQQMSNVQFTENMTEEQLDAMAGSETLRYQATSFGMTRNNKALMKSTNRLRDSLLPKDQPQLAIPLLLLIAQYRSTVVINADGSYVKMVSEQFDRCHGTLLQYVEFLSNALSPASTYAQLIPTLSDLIHKYHLEPEVAFLIYHPVMRLFRCSTGCEVFWPLDTVEDRNTSTSDNLAPSTKDLILDMGDSSLLKWSDLLSTVKSMLPPKSWNSLSPDLYTTFWGLTLYDLHVPRSRYDSEIAKQHAALKALEEFSDNSSSAITKRKKDKERIQELLDRLTGELQKHEQHVASVYQRLTHEKDKWLSSCPDTLKINMEFFQRCIFPRCIFSTPDAVYCSVFVQTLHSLGTPFFNTVNHIDIFICKLLQPMICSCTEYEAGRLGRFLYETLKIAYHWKSDESIYERECGNKPGFAVYYRFPNSPRLTFGQFVRVHVKWSTRTTKLLIQCLESTEYMEIRNALITLTKISSVFPVTRKSGVNLEKRVAKIRSEDREDLKVLATGVAAALAARRNLWISEEEFGMGYIDLKPAASPAKLGNLPNGSASNIQTETAGPRSGTVQSEGPIVPKDHGPRNKPTDQRMDRSENPVQSKSDMPSHKTKVDTTHTDGSSVTSASNGSKIAISTKSIEDSSKGIDEAAVKLPKTMGERETKPKRSTIATSVRQAKQEPVKDDAKSSKSRVGNQSSSTAGDKDTSALHPSEIRQIGAPSLLPANGSDIEHGETADGPRFSRPPLSPLHDDPLPPKSSDKHQRRPVSVEEAERVSKRRKAENESKDGQFLDIEKIGNDEQNRYKSTEKIFDKAKGNERYEKDHIEKLDRADKARPDDFHDKTRDRSIERYGRERSVEKVLERGSDRGADRLVDRTRDDRNKEERSKPRHSESVSEKALPEDHSYGQSLPPPPPTVPPNYTPQSVSIGRRDEESDRRVVSRHGQRLSPRHDDKERRHSEENLSVSQDDAKRKRDDDFRERKHGERDSPSMKIEDRERDRGNTMKDDTEASKRRKIKRELPANEATKEFALGVQAHPSLALGTSQPFDGRERGDRKATNVQHRAPYMDEAVSRLHGKETSSKVTRRESDQMSERDREEEKRQRNEAKRKHRK